MGKRVLCAWALLGAMALLLPSAATAQEEKRFEAFGGFTYLFADVGGSGFVDVSGPGFNAEFAFFLNDWLGLGAEVGYNTGGFDLDIPAISIFPESSRLEVDFSQWTVLFGPRFRIADSERFRVGAQVMAGMARGSADVEFDIERLIAGPPGVGPGVRLLALDFSESETAFAAMFGVHFDLKLTERLTWRVVQPDVLITSYGNDGQAHFRLSSGLGFDF